MWATAVVDRFAAIQVPIVAGRHPHGVGGVSYRLMFGDGFARATFEWWASGPEAWQPLIEVFRETWTNSKHSLEVHIPSDLGGQANMPLNLTAAVGRFAPSGVCRLTAGR